MKIWYLYHSGFAVDTGAHVLIFDYWRDTPHGGSLEDGVIDPKALRDRDVLVFASHRHGDHYNKAIFQWGREIQSLRIILSDDIPHAPGTLRIAPNSRLEQPDCIVETLRSTDEGVAFLVELDGLRIYHAGDLNWWHWEGEPDAYNRDMAANYHRQIALLGRNPINLAFVPVDPRLGEQYAWGLDYLMKTANVVCAAPMHFGDEASVVERLLADSVTLSYRDRILPFTQRGQMAER